MCWGRCWVGRRGRHGVIRYGRGTGTGKVQAKVIAGSGAGIKGWHTRNVHRINKKSTKAQSKRQIQGRTGTVARR